MTQSLRYMPQLDSLRAIAVACVMYSHFVPNKWHFGISFGPMGVQLFFVLSGYPITSILLKYRVSRTTGNAFRTFYIRRFLRIFPLYYVTLAICLMAGLCSLKEGIWHAGYLSNVLFFLENSWPGALSHFWSLSVEEQFYLFWPAVILLSSKRSLSYVIWCVAIIGTMAQLLGPWLYPKSKLWSVLPFMNLDSLGAGALLAMYGLGNSRVQKFMEQRWILVSCFVAMGIVAMLNHRGFETASVVRWMNRLALVVGSLWIVGNASKGFNGNSMAGMFLNFRALTFLGQISYGIYVWHNFVPTLFHSLADQMQLHDSIRFGIPGLLLCTILTFAIASMSWRILEAPILQYKSKFAP